MSFIQDFKAFALKGNVVDMAVGVQVLSLLQLWIKQAIISNPLNN